MTTFFSVQSYTSAVSDLRGWSEQQLIAAAKTGRRAPFGELCERHRKRVSYVTRRIMRNREDAEDATQECFLNETEPAQPKHFHMVHSSGYKVPALSPRQKYPAIARFYALVYRNDEVQQVNQRE